MIKYILPDMVERFEVWDISNGNDKATDAFVRQKPLDNERHLATGNHTNSAPD